MFDIFRDVSPWAFIPRVHKPIGPSAGFSSCTVRHAHIFLPLRLILLARVPTAEGGLGLMQSSCARESPGFVAAGALAFVLNPMHDPG